jgi:hypothetical protein
MKPLDYADSDIVKAIARIQHEHGWDFGIAPSNATLEDLVAMSNQLTDEFPNVSSKRLLRCLIEANDQEPRK